MKTEYTFDGKCLVMRDKELGMAIEESFCPQMLPPFNDLDRHKEVKLEKSSYENEIGAGFFTENGYDGHYRAFTVEGKLRAECYYLQGMLHGPSRFYSPKNGQCLSESWFYRGLQYGRAQRFALSGQLLALERYFKGKREGKQLYYYPDGSLKTEMSYAKGYLEGKALLFWSNGKKKRECNFNRGEREGVDRMWNPSEELTDEGEYVEGTPIGSHRCWHDNGKLRSMRVYHTHDRFDLWEWDMEGELTYEGIFDGKLNYLEKKWKEGECHIRKGKWLEHGIKWEKEQT